MELKHISFLKTSDFWLLSHYKLVMIMSMKHGRLTKNVWLVFGTCSKGTQIQIGWEAGYTFKQEKKGHVQLLTSERWHSEHGVVHLPQGVGVWDWHCLVVLLQGMQRGPNELLVHQT